MRTFVPKYAEMALEAMRHGMTLLEFCREQKKADSDFPTSSDIRDWADAVPEYSQAYARARIKQAEYWADEIQDICNDGRNDYMQRKKNNGEYIPLVDHECTQRSKLRVETRKWLLSKLHPTVYAERIQHQTLGADGRAVDPPSAVTPIDLSAALKGWRPKE